MKIKVFTAFSGYDSQCLALNRLCRDYPGFDYELAAWCEIEDAAIKAHNALFPQWADRISNTLTGVTKDNLIMTKTNTAMELTYHEHPTKEDLLEYFGQRIRVRKMTERTAMRLMDVYDADIDKIMNATETVTLKNGTVKTKKAISKTALYKLAGNSIVVSCLYHIFRTMFIPDQPENKQPIQKSLFDI